MNSRKPLLLIVSSPSGAGKTTLCKKLLKEFKNIRFSISHTTRTPRSNEINGVDYEFVNQDQFDQMKENKQFAEWAHVHGNQYGTPHSQIEKAAGQNQDLIFDVDYQGARQIKSHYPEAIGIFILPPSIKILKERLSARGTETPQSLERRYKAALEEISHFDEFDYLLVNDDIDAAYNRLRSILVAERIKTKNSSDIINKIIQ